MDLEDPTSSLSVIPNGLYMRFLALSRSSVYRETEEPRSTDIFHPSRSR